MFSITFSSGHFGGSGSSVMLDGVASAEVVEIPILIGV
jgi:hypothetical protein